MPDTVEIERDGERYWALGSAFQEIQIMELNEALKKHGVGDAQLRQAICSRFAFGMGNFLDQYWMEVDGRKYYPLLCFSEKFLDVDVAPHEIGPVQAPAGFEFHDGADDMAIFYFRDQSEKLARARIGTVGDEDEVADSDGGEVDDDDSAAARHPPWNLRSQIIPAASEAFRNKDYARCVELLAPFEDVLDKVASARLALARKKCSPPE